MLFSIVIPMYNVECFIKDCLDSIINQKFSDYEIILVDDGSTDKTVYEAETFINQYRSKVHIELIRKENSGASESRNLGLKRSTGKYIIFMDSDDVMLPNSLNVMAEATQSNADLYVFSLKKNIDGCIKDSTLTDLSPFYIRNEQSINLIDEYLRKTNFKITWQPWSKLFLREIIEKNNLHFDSRLHSCNDFNFFFNFFFCAHSVQFINTPTTLYTVDRIGAISTTKIMRRVQSNTLAYKIFFENVYCTDSTRNEVLDYASYLFLCALDLCSELESEDLKIVKKIIQNNKEIYYYSQRKTAIMKRFLFRIFGLKSGAYLYSLFRSKICDILKFKRTSDL